MGIARIEMCRNGTWYGNPSRFCLRGFFAARCLDLVATRLVEMWGRENTRKSFAKQDGPRAHNSLMCQQPLVAQVVWAGQLDYAGPDFIVVLFRAMLMRTLPNLVVPTLLSAAVLAADLVFAAGRYAEVSYPPSTEPGALQYGVTYTLWLPDGVERIRGLIVHQHGCGAGACKGGETAAYDLHWQALASKWECGLLGPSYHQEDGQDCRLWCDPRNGSEQAFLKALSELAAKTEHPELDEVPWCLWGHSGGAFWASLMQTKHPERIVAIWLRSGTAYSTWEKGEIPKPEIPAAAYGIPMMCNPGAKEQGDKRFDGAFTGAMAMFRAYRAKGAPIGFAPDPRTSHECGDSRYLAIAFFDVCLSVRLPDKRSVKPALKPVEQRDAWLATVPGVVAVPAPSYESNALEAAWLPNERIARAWIEYVKTGAVSDATAPPIPVSVKVAADDQRGNVVTWDAEADLESGLQAFVVLRDGEQIGQIPEKPIGRFGRPLFQTMSYHDTPEKPLPEMRFVDATAKPGEKHKYQVIAINSVGVRSEPSEAVTGEK